MSKYRNPEWIEQNTERVNTLRSRGHIFYDALQELKGSLPENCANKLLKEDGAVVLLINNPIELPDFYSKLLERGEFVIPEKLDIFKGESSHCHSNSCALWCVGSGIVSLVTGFGLSEDGIWRRHSWCVRNKDNFIIETTEPRVLYCGIKLTYDESNVFVEL